MVVADGMQSVRTKNDIKYTFVDEIFGPSFVC